MIDAKLDELLAEVRTEYDRATNKFGAFASGHEGLAVVEEEFMELRSGVFWGVDQRGHPADIRTEAIQLAAMAVRFLHDVVDKP